MAYRTPTSQLRYGRVSADSRAQAGMPAYRITVEIRPGTFKDLLSTEVLCIGPGVQQASISSNGASTSGAVGSSGSLPSVAAVGGAAGPSEPEFKGGVGGQAVSPGEVMSAVKGMMASVGLSMEADKAKLLEQALMLQQQLQAAQQEVDKLRSTASGAATEAEQMKISWQCRICLSKEVNTAMSACGHLLCADCAASLPRRACPFCRKGSGYVKLFK